MSAIASYSDAAAEMPLPVQEYEPESASELAMASEVETGQDSPSAVALIFLSFRVEEGVP